MGYSDILFENIYDVLKQVREWFDEDTDVPLHEIDSLVRFIANTLKIVVEYDIFRPTPERTAHLELIDWKKKAIDLIKDFEETANNN